MAHLGLDSWWSQENLQGLIIRDQTESEKGDKADSHQSSELGGSYTCLSKTWAEITSSDSAHLQNQADDLSGQWVQSVVLPDLSSQSMSCPGCEALLWLCPHKKANMQPCPTAQSSLQFYQTRKPSQTTQAAIEPILQLCSGRIYARDPTQLLNIVSNLVPPGTLDSDPRHPWNSAYSTIERQNSIYSPAPQHSSTYNPAWLFNTDCILACTGSPASDVIQS